MGGNVSDALLVGVRLGSWSIHDSGKEVGILYITYLGGRIQPTCNPFSKYQQDIPCLKANDGGPLGKGGPTWEKLPNFRGIEGRNRTITTLQKWPANKKFAPENCCSRWIFGTRPKITLVSVSYVFFWSHSNLIKTTQVNWKWNLKQAWHHSLGTFSSLKLIWRTSLQTGLHKAIWSFNFQLPISNQLL